MQLHRVPYTHVLKIGRFEVSDTSESADANEAGEVLLDGEQLERYERRALIAITERSTSIDGAVLSFARRSLGLRQVEFAALLDYSEFQISRMENGREKIPRALQLAVGNIVGQVHNEGDAAIERLRSKRSAGRRFEISSTATAARGAA
jgi:DNA-binding transcriptional regulator YiaG